MNFLYSKGVLLKNADKYSKLLEDMGDMGTGSILF